MKRILSLFLTVIMLMGVCVPVFAAGTAEEALAGKDIYVFAKHGSMSFLLKDGEPFNVSHRWAHLIDDRNGVQKEYPAYCLQHGWGADQINVTYIKEFMTNPVIWGMVTNGFGYKTNGELGVQTDDQAYYATQVAIWSYCMGYDINSFSAGDPFVLAALKQIYAAGLATNEVMRTVVTATPDTATVETDNIDPSYASQTYTVTANVQINGYTVNFQDIAAVPAGAVITDIYNNPKNSFSAGEQFKILIPANEIYNKTGAFKLTLVADVKTEAVLYLVNYIAEHQDFTAGYDPFEFWNEEITVNYAHQDTYIEIFKVADGTNTPLSGAVFRVTDALGGVIGTFVTDASGRVVVPLTKDGAYYIDEITAPTGYLLGANTHQDVTVVWNVPATVTFANKTKPGLSIRKVDADTNAPLRGVTFRIAKNGGSESVDVVTDGSGTAFISGLMPGTYTVTEIAVPEGYILDSTPKMILLVAGETASITFKNHQKPGIVIKKYDEKTMLPLAGAEFSIAKKGGSIVYEGITDSTGVIRVDGLDEGWYTITEIAAPTGYLIATESKDVYLNAGATVEIKFDNRLRPALTVIKLDRQTGEPLAGAKFRVQKTQGGTVSEYVTGANGMFTVYDLDEAIYTVTEIEAPNGYMLDSEPHKDILLMWGEVQTLVFTDTPKPGLTIKKMDADTGALLAGAKVRVAKKGGAEFTDVITDAYGSAFLDKLEPGTYIITEIAAPDGYLLNDTPQTIIVEAGEHYTAVIKNHKKPVLVINKYDEQTGLRLPGAEFSVAKKGGAIVWEGMVDANGQARIEGLDEGWYTVTELAAPFGYIKAEPKDVFLQGGKVVELKFDNRPRPALRIIKVDEQTKQPLAGAKFRVWKTEDNTTSEYISGADGTITIYNLDESIYSVEEISAPKGYILDPQHKDIELEWGKTKELVFTNKEKPALIILKIDSVTTLPLQGAEFSIRHKDGSVVWEGLTDENGEIRLYELDADWYTITEILPPPGYLADTAPKDVKFEPDKVTQVKFDNTRKPVLVFQKTNGLTGKGIPGATFRVEYEMSSGGLLNIGSYKTDADGRIIIPQVNPGWYVFTETLPANGFSLPANPVTRLYVSAGQNAYLPEFDKYYGVNGTDIGQGGTITPPITVYVLEEHSGSEYYVQGEGFNWPLNSVVIKKAHAITGELLAGAAFELYRADEQVSGVPGTAIGRYTTDNSGIVVITGLEPGYYVVKEVQAPQNFLISENSQQNGYLKADGTTVLEFAFANYPYGSLLITKTDAQTGVPLAGAKFKVTTSTGTVVGTSNGEFTTDSKGEILITNLKPGAYVVTELTAPEGYALTSLPRTITIGTDGQTYRLDFTNEPLGSLVIRKLDSATKQPLAGAEFYVTTATGSVVGTSNGIFVTDSTGTIEIPNLARGSYIIKETKAPDGYVLENKTQTVYVSYGLAYTVTVENAKMSGAQIVKIDASTKQPLKDARFTVYKKSGEFVGSFTTNGEGIIILDKLEPGWYKAVETKAPDGYLLDDTPMDFEVTSNQFIKLTFENKQLSSLQIRKESAVDGSPLAGAVFEVRKQNGEYVGEFTTGIDGAASIPNIAPGWYVVSEIKAPQGYILDSTAKTVEVKPIVPTVVMFTNRPLSGIEIIKTDATTGAPLAGAIFTVERPNGERVGDNNGKYTTDTAGKALVPDLKEGVYIISEIQAPNEYVLDAQPQTVEVKSGKLTIVEFTNKPFPYLYIKKVDAATGQLLAGAQFTVAKQNGEVIANVTSLSTGAVAVKVAPGVYVITEVKPPAGYELNDPVQTVEVRADGSTIYNSGGSSVPGNTVTFANKALNTIEIVKLDAVTKNPLSNAMFTVDKANGERIGSYRTDSSGKILVTDLSEGTYIISETAAPNGYILNESPKSVNVSGGKLVSVEFLNKPLSGIQIVKLDSITHNPLQGAAFTVTKANGERVGTFRTEADGKVIISDLDEGVYVVGEITAPDGYVIDETPKNVTVKSGQLATVEFVNKPLSGIVIVKTDAVTHQPLSGATFEVKRANGEKIGTYKTDVSGKAVISGLEEGAYIVSETIAPDNYILDNTPQTVTVKSGRLTEVEFTNKPFSGIEIRKVDSITGDPLAGAVFEVRKQNGEYVTEVTTDSGGRASVANAQPGWYVITETKAPQGYVIDGTAKTIEVKSGVPTVVTFTNKPLSGIQILKIDAVTKAPLMGATFTVERDNGEKIGTYKTDVAGKIIVSGLADGTYIVSETAAPEGYILDAQPQTVIVKSGKLTVAEFSNKPLAGLKIIKLDSVTRNPIAGVEFAVSKVNGEKVENEFRGYTFKTDSTGQIFIPQLADGYYIVTETKAADGYILEGEPKTVLVQSGKTTLLEVYNTPQSGLLIVKTDEATGKPLAGVVFDVRRADGQFVAGLILDGNQPNTEANSPNKSTSPNGDITGSYTTDTNGRIQINGLPAGEYHVTERKALDGYELDTDVHSVTVTPGKLATLQLTNRQKAGLRLLKIDSVTKKPIYGVEFMVFDANNKVVGNYVTDNNGLIDFTGILTEGRYTIRETRPADGYYRDEMPRTVEFKSGRITEVVWENTPCMGQIQIMKLSGDDNEVNGLPKGTPLAGAIFEVYNYKSGNLVDRFVSGADGRAVSKPLPLGRYIVKEVQAPQWYKLSTESMDIEIEFATQIIKRDFLNYSANTGVRIRKVGNYEAMPGDSIRYDIKEVGNTSTVPLTDFYWRDILPTDAVRLEKIVTGTYNQSLKYKILITTNKGDTRVIADNLSTTVNNSIDCRPAALGLRSDEYVTSFTLVFGTVKAGFCQVLTPQVFVTVNKNLPNGYQFVNKADVGGKYYGEWVISNSTWVTTIYTQPSKLPRTGY